MAPIKTGFGTSTGQVTDRLVAYFRRRAEGGVGLIISEPLYVDRRGVEHPNQLGIDGDDKLAGLRRLTEAVHEGGARIFAHLNHGGRAANPKAAGGPPEAPSRVPCGRTGIEPEVLTQERIATLVRAFASAARRARSTGFDGVELQFGLGYLISQFLSPATNLRTDEYGIGRGGRMHFAREVFTVVRGMVGEDFPIGIRISGSEKAPRGLGIENAMELALRLDIWGADLIHVATGSICESLPWYFQHMALTQGVNEALAAWVRKQVDLPVMAAGRLGDPHRIREVLGADLVDMVALGRPLLADPDLPHKLLEDRDEEVLLCGHCLQGCFASVKAGRGIGCNFNPEVGQESKVEAPSSSPRRVVVVGGGPAGMQAALTAWRRGHQVTLLERRRLGGQFVLASLPPHKQRIHKPLDSLMGQVDRSGIEVVQGEDATVEGIRALEPDAIIIATGSRPIIPDIPGLDAAVTVEEVLKGRQEVGHRVLILGGGMVGLEVAEFLASRGKQCTVIEALDEVARDMDPISRKMLLKRLDALPVEILKGCKLVRLEDGRPHMSVKGEPLELEPFASVVVAAGSSPRNILPENLGRAGFKVSVVGDAAKPGSIQDAVRSGHSAALSI